MLKNKVLVRQADGSIREVQISDGGTVSLRGNEQLLIAAAPEQAQVRSGGEGKVAIRLEGVGEFTVESEGLPPEALAMGPDQSPVFRGQPVIVFERAGAGGEEEAVTHEPLGVHEASVADTAFLDQQTGEDFGMGELLGMAAFSAEAGAGLGKGKLAAGKDEEDGLPLDGLTSDGLSGDSSQDHRNLPPIIDLNKTLLVDDDATERLTGHLRATDRESGPEDLRFRISQGPVHGVLYLNGAPVTDFSDAVFTQADLDSGRVTFRFVPHAQDTTLVLEDDSFTFTVTDGVNTTGPATFRIHNTTVQVWGTGNDDDLTGVANFDRADTKFHVYGFDGNDTLRGGSGADTLDGGGHTSTDFSIPGQGWSLGIAVPGATPGGDTVDYSASSAAVDVDLTCERQSGGHAEGDVLRGIENVTGSRFGDTLRGDGSNNVLAGLAGADLLDGGADIDTADYRKSDAAVNVDLTRTGGQSGGHAEGDTLTGIENVIGSNHADSIVGEDGHNFLDGGAGNDSLLGGAGDDTLRSGAGTDSLEGGVGRDLADYSTSNAWVNIDLNRQDGETRQSGGGKDESDQDNHAEGDTLVGIEDVLGSRFNDVIKGDFKSNRLWGGDGDDTMYGDSGNDTIMGGSGNDWIDGGAHDDSIFGGAGNDTIYGGSGLDSIWGGDGDDSLVGGNDTYGDQLIGGWGNDTLDASRDQSSRGVGGGFSSCSALVGGAGSDMLIGNGRNTSASYELTGHADHTPNYGPGVYLDLRRQGKDEEGNWLAQIDPFGRETDAVGDTLTGIVHAVGTYADDTIIGNHKNNELYGMDGNDLLIGVEGNDKLWGGSGDDTFEGGQGADFIQGDVGFDIVTYENETQGVKIDLSGMSWHEGALQAGAGNEDGDKFWSIEGVIGGGGNDTLIGTEDRFNSGLPFDYGSMHNLLDGRGGNDFIDGRAGNDTLDGGAGNDTLMGGEGDDLLLGGEGDDLIHAGAGDKVDGGEGHDTLLSEDEHLDVASSTSITNIEHIDLTGAGKSLTVSGDAIVKNGVADPAGSGLMALIVTGDAGDSVARLADGWTWTRAAQDVVIGDDGLTYVMWEGVKDGQTVRLYVQTGLSEAVVREDGVVEITGTAGHDNLTLAWDFDDPQYTFHVRGLEGNDTLRGGINADTLDGGEHSPTVFFFPWQGIALGMTIPGETPEGDTVDYSASNAAVDVDLTRATQFGGHAEGDVLRGIENVTGSGFDDTLKGEAGDNVLAGLAGADLLDGGADIDTADYRRSDAAVDVDLTRERQSGGHAEGDTLAGIENVIGSNHADSIVGDAGHNFLDGGVGNDTIRGGDGNDTLMGGDGNDMLYANTWYFNSTLDGGSGDDSLYGGGADDSLMGGDGHDSLHGGSGQDSLMGGDGNDSLYGGDDDSDDTLDGGGGDDSLNGGAGNDTLNGGAGNDYLCGGNDSAKFPVDGSIDDGSSNILDGGIGEDSLYGGIGADSLKGGDGNDFLQGDRYSHIAKTGDDTLDGGAGNDSILGGSGHDLIIGGAGADTLNGWNGVDTADYSDSDASVMVNLGLGTGSGGHAEGDVLVAIENVVGSKHDDTLIGGNEHNTFFMGANLTNEDRIDGGAGFDHLFYTYNGEDPNAAHALDNVSNVDKIVLGDAATTIITKNGFAYSNFYPNTGVHIDASNLSKGHDLNLDASADMSGATFQGRYIVTGGAGNDTMIGWAGANSFEGGAGNDSLVGGVRNDNLVGGAGEDTLVGGAGNDSFMGGAGDIIDGGNGSDLLWSEDAHLNIASSTSISGIERILLEGDATSLTVSGDAIVKNGLADPAGSGLLALIVTGDAGDSVARLADGWTWTKADQDVAIGDNGLTYVMWEGVKDGQTVRLFVQTGLHEAVVTEDGVVEITGTAGHDNLTMAWDFDDPQYTFHVRGLEGNDTLRGGINGDTLDGGAGNDILMGGEGDDLLLGGVDDDLIHAGAGDTVDGGEGFDTLISEDERLDVASSTSITNIERIDLTGAGKSLGVSGDAILSNGVLDPMGGGMKALIVTGDAGDVVHTSGDSWGWQNVSEIQTLSDGKSYCVYEAAKDGEKVRLYVQEDGPTFVGLFHDDLFVVYHVYNEPFEPIWSPSSPEDYNSIIADYRDSPASVHVDLNLQDGVTAQSGGDPGNTADGDILQNISILSGSHFNDTLICAKNGVVTDIFGLGGNDTIFGDGEVYRLHGDAGDDILHLNLNGEDVFGSGTTILPEHIGELDGGDGSDTLVLGDHDGGGVTLDLSSLVTAEKITGIEHVDITGDADDANTLTLTASDVLGTTDGADTLWVHGDANDTVTTTDTGWTHVRVETGADGQQYNHYSGYAGSTLVNLMIDADLANQNVMHA